MKSTPHSSLPYLNRGLAYGAHLKPEDNSSRAATGLLDARPDLLCLLHGLFDGADQVERLLRDVVQLAPGYHLEALDGVLYAHVLAGRAGELLRDEERLREEPLDLPRPRDDHLVLLRELVHAEDGDDVLKVLVLLDYIL